MSRLVLTRQSPQHVEHYAEQTRQIVEDLAAALQILFEDERAGRLSKAWAATLDRLFTLWCEQSGVVPPGTARAVLEEIDPHSLPEILKAVNTELGFASEEATRACEEYVARAQGRYGQEAALRRLEQRLYAPQIRSLCLQSAHVTLARAVLYRVLEDRGLAAVRVSGAPLSDALEASRRGLFGASSTPALRLLEDMRDESEGFLPSLYQRRELDWWLVPFPRGSAQQALFDERVGSLDVELARMLGLLDGYDFASVDQDVWRDVYEHHLPWEERQRLGSFYTPDALVRVVLDLVEWDIEEGIETQTIADIACGSGAFLVEALRRRRAALQRARRLPDDPTPEQLDELLAGVVGLDVHPFATFLASVNLLFQVIDLYESVRRRHPHYTLPLNVFTVDALEDAGVHPRQAYLQEGLPEDIRVRHTEQEVARYRALRGKRFDIVVGNPPWGGVLKGRLSPLNDPEKRQGYRSGRFDTATGKYDIFVLFVERSIRWLRDGGRYGFVVPSAYRDKDFGRGLRGFLAERTTPRAIVDVPFGQLLFRAMNTPSLLAGENAQDGDGQVRIVKIDPSLLFMAAPSEREHRHAELVDALLAGLSKESAPGVVTYDEPVTELREWGQAPWPLDERRALREAAGEGGDVGIGLMLEPRQGVTPGGEGVLAELQFTGLRARELGLERELLHPAVRGRDLEPGAARALDRLQLYPYLLERGASRPAFVKEGRDALAPDPHDAQEAALVAGSIGRERHRRLVQRRIAEGSCPFPGAAEYLLDRFDLLASRRPKDRPFESFGRSWWEYLWPRDPGAMLAVPKLIGPRLTIWPRFALDEEGLLPTDSCMALSAPASVEGKALARRMRERLEERLGALSTRDFLVYVLAFLNATPAAATLRIGRLPTPKGSWTVDESYLAAVRLAVPADHGLTRGILQQSDAVVAATRAEKGAREERRELDGLVVRALGLPQPVARELAAWAAEVNPT